MAFFIVVKYSSHKIYHLKLFLNVQFSKSHPYREEKIINKEKCKVLSASRGYRVGLSWEDKSSQSSFTASAKDANIHYVYKDVSDPDRCVPIHD